MRSVLGILFVLVALGCWWLWSEQATAPSPMPHQTRVADDSAAVATGPTANETAATTVPASALPERTSVVPADHTWIVRGRVMKAHAVPYPGAQLRVQCFVGPAASGSPLDERALTADAEGRFAWPLPVPTGTVTLVGEGTMPKHAASKVTLVVPKGEPAPQDLEVWVSPLDRIVTGTVLDAQQQPIPGAWVGTPRNKQPVARDGTFRIEQASGHGTTYLDAGARGFTTLRQMLGASDRPEFAAHFTLQPGFRIAGRITDEQGQPLAGATVATFYTTWEPELTDAEGRYEITQADPARESHMLFARKSGYTETRVEVDGKNPLPVYDLVLRLGVRVHGRVFDPLGRAIARAQLYIGFSPTAHNRLDAVSDDDGMFEFPAVEAGKQTLVTSKKGLAPDTRLIEVPKDQRELGLDVHLQVAHFLAGVVVDDQGRGHAGVSISVLAKRPADSQVHQEHSEYLDLRATAGADGSFRLDGLPAGVVDLEVYSQHTVRHTQRDVAVDRGDVRLVVKHAAQFAAKVVDDATGEPVREFRVHFIAPTLRDGESRIGGYSSSWVREGNEFRSDDGVFRTKGEAFEVGAVGGIEVSAKGYAPTRNTHVVAAVDPDPAACVVRLQRGGTITGKVIRAADGQPVANARVAHSDPARPPLYVDEVGGQLHTSTAADGTFTIADVPAGEATLQITAPGLPSHRDGPIAIQAGVTIERLVVVPAGATITGVVCDTDHRALPGARVTIRAEGDRGAVDLTSDELGRFQTTAPLAPGDYAVSARASRDGVAFALHQRVTLLAGQTLEVEVKPSGRGVLRGKIVGEAAAGQTFRLHAWLRQPGAKVQPYFSAPCAEGKFELRGLPAGDYQLMVQQDQGRASGSAKCKVAETEPTVIEVTVTAGGER